MHKTLPIAAALILLPMAARADGFDFRELYGRAKSLAELLLVPTPDPTHRGNAEVPAAEIDPKMALIPRGTGRLRIIAPPGTPGGDRKTEPR